MKDKCGRNTKKKNMEHQVRLLFISVDKVKLIFKAMKQFDVNTSFPPPQTH